MKILVLLVHNFQQTIHEVCQVPPDCDYLVLESMDLVYK